ncbi:MAG: hypothetical protein LBH37_03560 [Oscillospiraceae bacterium]|jgi:predicted HTH transcriptional regulator|nr:hypothetical protein [Oscillospiraceae bacterium]
MLLPDTAVNDLDDGIFKYFRQKEIESKRLSEDFVSCKNEQLPNKLKLTKGGKITRVGVLLFHDSSENFCTGGLC